MSSSESRSNKVTITSPRGTTLQIDERYKSASLNAVLVYLFALLKECADIPKAVNPTMVVKLHKVLVDAEQNATGLLLDLIDIRASRHPGSVSFWSFNKHCGDLAMVHKIIVNNKIFIGKFLALEHLMTPAKLLELSCFGSRTATGAEGQSIQFFVWDTNVITNENEIYKCLNKWLLRQRAYESEATQEYPFEFLVPEPQTEDTEDAEEIIQAPTETPAPPAAKRVYRGKKN